ncbi:carboxypeptidase regulatory-like domain-containing protein [Halopiger goleimassiliensis]|uniref:carboxypeptidase regulatory-like domain-containing protein n=1 Tax=Halopiger goleimassiliensis TaxID=1293048 RepID=UPI0006780C11|nr:carboxypeptidase regulatory-like domain-containing protein [Halopiger goleimassiliensis]
MRRRVTLGVATAALLLVATLAFAPAAFGLAEGTALSLESDDAGAETTHTWSVDDVDFDGEVDAIAVDYPVGTSLDGLDDGDVTVELTREGESEPTEISVNSDAYAGSAATFDLSGNYNTDIDGPVVVEIDGIENPPAGDGEATLTFVGDDTVAVDAAFSSTESATAPDYADAALALESDAAGAPTVHSWTLEDIAYEGEVDTITVDYPDGTRFDGLEDGDVTVGITRAGEDEPTTIDVNSDTYAGSQATFDLSGWYDTDVDGPVTVTVDGLENPPAGEHAAVLVLDGDDTVTAEATFAVGETDDALALTITDADGEPLAETPVAVELEGPSETVALTTTDADGVATVDVSEAGTYEVTVTAQEKGTATDTVAVAGETEASITLETPTTGAIDALVTDADGDPLPEGTWVAVDGDGAFGPVRTGQVGTDGTVLLEGIEPGTYDLTATTVAHGETDARTVSVPAGGTAATELTYADAPTSGTIAGTVSTPDGDPLAETTVVVEYDGPETGVSIVETDADGAFALDRVPAGAYEVAVTVQGYASSDPVTVDATAGEQTEFVVTDPETGAIAGTVTDAEGEPLPEGTWVTFAADGFEADETVQLEADGEFLLEGVAPGEYAVVAETLSHGETAAVDLAVAADETTTVEFTYAESDDGDVPEDRGEDVPELHYWSEDVDGDVVVHGDVEGDVVLGGATEIDGDLLIAGDVAGDVIVRGASSVDRILVGGAVEGDVRLLGSGSVGGDVTAESVETVAVRGNAAIEGSLEVDAIGSLEVVGSGSIGDVALETVDRIDLRGGSSVDSVTVADETGTFEVRGGVTVDGTVSLSTVETVRLVGGVTVAGDLVATEVTAELDAPSRLVDGEILIEETPDGASNGPGNGDGPGNENGNAPGNGNGPPWAALPG